MDNKLVNAIIQIRKNKDVPDSVTDDEIGKLIDIGNKLRAEYRADVEIEYDRMQQLAIICATAYEIANDEDLDDFDFDAFDKEFEARYFS